MKLSFDFKHNLQELQAKNARMSEELLNRAPAMKQISTFLNQWVLRNFASSGGKVGGWEPYKYGGRITTKKQGAKSVDGKHYVNASAKMLMDSGAMRLSFLPFSSNDVAGIGSNLHSKSGAPYPMFHDQGTSTLPQRRLVPVDNEVSADVHEILENWLRVTIKKAYK